jgi:hypothetical protein
MRHHGPNRSFIAIVCLRCPLESSMNFLLEQIRRDMVKLVDFILDFSELGLAFVGLWPKMA